MEGHFSTGQSPLWAVVPMEEEEEEEEVAMRNVVRVRKYSKMDKRAKDKLVRSPRENGGG